MRLPLFSTLRPLRLAEPTNVLRGKHGFDCSENQKLVELVREHPCLYYARLSEHGEAQLTYNFCQNIANGVNRAEDIEECRWDSSLTMDYISEEDMVQMWTASGPDQIYLAQIKSEPANYVKFIESAGARVVPIFVNKTNDYYKELFESINGALWPGGGQCNLLESSYGKAGKALYDLAVQSKQGGDYFPIWGACQGFELMVSLAAGKNILTRLESVDKNLNVTLSPDVSASKLLSGDSEAVLDALQTKAVTYNHHDFSLTPTAYGNSGELKPMFKILSTSKNDCGKQFISTIEAANYPFYGVQYHPEKPIFTWPMNTSIKHDPTSIMVSQYFANFFVNEARSSSHTFRDSRKEQEALIFNYEMVFLKGKEDLDQAYFF